MEQNSQDKSEIEIIEDQIRECYGRVVWTHKTQEKAADLVLSSWNKIKVTQIIVSAIVTSSLIISLLGDGKTGTIISAVLSTFLLGLNLFLKNYDLGKVSQKHCDTANKLWVIREEYLSLLIDIRAKALNIDEIRKRRDLLQEKVSKVYQVAPRTNGKAYSIASKSLKECEEMTFSDEEIDKFLPRKIRRKN